MNSKHRLWRRCRPEVYQHRLQLCGGTQKGIGRAPTDWLTSWKRLMAWPSMPTCTARRALPQMPIIGISAQGAAFTVTHSLGSGWRWSRGYSRKLERHKQCCEPAIPHCHSIVRETTRRFFPVTKLLRELLALSLLVPWLCARWALCIALLGCSSMFSAFVQTRVSES